MSLAEASAKAVESRVVTSASGVSAHFTENGCLSAFEAFGLSLLQYPSSAVEAGLANVHLRRHCTSSDGASAEHLPLLGPLSGSAIVRTDAGQTAAGSWRGLDYTLTFRLADPAADGAPDDTPAAWFWDATVTNTTDEPVRLDLTMTHDPGLAPIGAVRTNEYYVSQYLDVSPVEVDGHGTALAVRQNMPGAKVPWMMVGSLRRGVGWATDAVQLVTRTAEGVRWTALDSAELPAARQQHEHTLMTLQDEPIELAPGETRSTGFFGIAVADHPAATGPDDAAFAEQALAAWSKLSPVDAGKAAADGAIAVPTLFAGSPVLATRPLTPAELDTLGVGPADGTVETTDDAANTALSWPTERGQLVTAAKDLAVLRPHGQILRTGDSFSPDTSTLTSTIWMAGTFGSQLTRGHVGRSPVITGRRTYFGLQRAHGIRLFVAAESSSTGWALLETPSAWSNELDRCTWWYATDDGFVLEVVSSAPADRHELGLDVRVVAGTPRAVLVTIELGHGAVVAADSHSDSGLTINGQATDDPTTWQLTWTTGAIDEVADDAPLFADLQSRGLPWITLGVDASTASDWGLRITASAPATDALTDEPTSDKRLGEGFWSAATAIGLSLDPGSEGVDAAQLIGNLDAALPWFAQNALVHFLSPRGLEQYSGGAWGTRDICQGPVGLLTALGRQADVRAILLRIFKAQNDRGDWAQAFDFLPPITGAGQYAAHGDVIFWPLLAAGEYLLATADGTLLSEKLQFTGDDGPAPEATIEEHLRRAIAHIQEHTVPGSPLPAYGHGDWNDSLQPADPRLAKRLVSTWTAVLQTHTLRSLANGLRAAGVTGTAVDLAEIAADLADRTETALHSVLLVDDLLPGYMLFGEDGTREPLVHPDDTRTGLHYGVLPWIHAIAADLLSPEQARHHLLTLEQHLLGPDGARLFDRPAQYSGGPMEVFQRAEASTFWGREIGLMYMHAHLRYAEALARVGETDALLRALALVSPVGIHKLVAQARPRQTTCYYSSSDGAFADRYDAQDHYADLMAGGVALEGGWRVYSSGPGLALRLIVEALLGIRARGQRVEIDPVLASGLDGLRASVPLAGRVLQVSFVVGAEGVGVRAVRVNGRELALGLLDNPYRRAGVSVVLDDLLADVDGPAAITVETY